MIDIHFYHLTRHSLEQALSDLLFKTLEKNWKAVVLASSEERVEFFNQYLWSYPTDGFLPHGSEKDGRAELQPVWLTTLDERPNGAQVLFLTEGSISNRFSEYERVCELFDGSSELSVSKARERWKSYKALGYNLNYWMQGEKGWSKQGAAS